MVTQLLGPDRVDARVHPGPQAGRLHELLRHDELRLLAEEGRARTDAEAGAAGAEVLASLFVAHADVGEQSGEERLVDGIGVHLALPGPHAPTGHVQTDLFRGLLQLCVEVLPLPDPQIVEELRLAHPPEGTRAEGSLLLLEVGPQLQPREEVARLVREALVRGVGELLLVLGPLARVLDRQRGDDDQDLPEDAPAVRLDDHARVARVDRQRGDGPAVCREPASRTSPPLGGRLGLLLGGEGLQLLEEPDAVGDLSAVRGVEEREAGDVTEPERGHLEDDRREVGPQDLRVGELGPREVVVLGVEADRDALRHAAAPPGTLVGRRLADRLDRKALDLGALAVAGDPGGAGVDDVADAGDRERGLGDVRREDDAASGVGLEDPVLFGCGESGIERHHLRDGKLHPVQGVGRVADLALPREEHEDVAAGTGMALGPELLDRLADAGDHVALVVVRPVRVDEGPITNLDRIGPTGDLDDGCRGAVGGCEVPGEPLGVDRRRRDDDLEVGAPRQELLEVAQDEVDVEAALVRLVDDDRVVATQLPVALELREEDAVRHHLDERVAGRLVGEPHLVADGAAQLDLQLLGEPLRDGTGRDPPRLGVADEPVQPAAELEADLRDLRRLAGPRLTGDDDDLVVPDGGGEVVPPLDHRQVLGKRDGGNQPGPSGTARRERVRAERHTATSSGARGPALTRGGSGPTATASAARGRRGWTVLGHGRQDRRPGPRVRTRFRWNRRAPREVRAARTAL